MKITTVHNLIKWTKNKKSNWPTILKKIKNNPKTNWKKMNNIAIKWMTWQLYWKNSRKAQWLTTQKMKKVLKNMQKARMVKYFYFKMTSLPKSKALHIKTSKNLIVNKTWMIWACYLHRNIKAKFAKIKTFLIAVQTISKLKAFKIPIMELTRLKDLLRGISKAQLEKEEETLAWVLAPKKIKTICNLTIRSLSQILTMCR